MDWLPMEFLHCRNGAPAAYSLPGNKAHPAELFFNPFAGQQSQQTQTQKLMSVQIKKDQKNGATKPAAPKTKSQSAKPQMQKKEDSTKLTLEERIQKVDELRSLTQKRQRTVDTLHDIRTFQFGSDENCTLVLTDSQGMKFATNNSNLISMLADYFTAILGDKVSALDDEIMAFKL